MPSTQEKHHTPITGIEAFNGRAIIGALTLIVMISAYYILGTLYGAESPNEEMSEPDLSLIDSFHDGIDA